MIDGLEKDEDKDFTVKALRSEWEWENSFDGVFDNLGHLNVGVTLEGVIVRAVHKLPPKVREFVYGRCVFVSFAEGGGQCYYKRTKRPWLIILGEKADESVVAHEIAHARLGHKCDLLGNNMEVAFKTETEACSLAKEWGFVGLGTEVDKEIIEAVERKDAGK